MCITSSAAANVKVAQCQHRPTRKRSQHGNGAESGCVCVRVCVCVLRFTKANTSIAVQRNQSIFSPSSGGGCFIQKLHLNPRVCHEGILIFWHVAWLVSNRKNKLGAAPSCWTCCFLGRPWTISEGNQQVWTPIHSRSELRGYSFLSSRSSIGVRAVLVFSLPR